MMIQDYSVSKITLSSLISLEFIRFGAAHDKAISLLVTDQK